MPTFKLVHESGTWLSDIRLGVPDVKAGDRIPDGRSFLEVLEVRDGAERLVTKSVTTKPALATGGLLFGLTPGSGSSPGWTRTNNPSVNSRMLCQLSYRGRKRPEVYPARRVLSRNGA